MRKNFLRVFNCWSAEADQYLLQRKGTIWMLGWLACVRERGQTHPAANSPLPQTAAPPHPHTSNFQFFFTYKPEPISEFFCRKCRTATNKAHASPTFGKINLLHFNPTPSGIHVFLSQANLNAFPSFYVTNVERE